MPLGQTAQVLRQVITLASDFYGVDPRVVESILIQESGLNPNVPNGDGGDAVGLGQFHIPRWQEVIAAHPEIQQRFRVTTNPIGRSKPEASIWAVAASLSDQLASNGGDYLAAVAQHNGSGPRAQAYAQTVLTRAQGASSMGHGGLPTVGDVLDNDVDGGEPGDIRFTEAWQEFLNRLDIAATDARQRGEFANAVALERFADDLRDARDAQGFSYDVALARLNADLQIRIDEARDQNDRETQIILKNLQAEIDAEAVRVGFEHDKWILDKQQAFEALQAQEGRDFTAEQNKLAIEAQERTSALGELGAFKRQLLETQARAKETLAGLAGNDPLRAAGFASGRVQRGRTPADVARSGLRAVINRQPPSVAPGASGADIRSALEGTPQPRLPAPSGALGLAGGGEFISKVRNRVNGNVIEMGRGSTGAFEIRPDSPTPDFGGNTGIGIIVGEGDGSPGKARELLEIMEGPTGIDKIRVIPIVARGAGGLEIDTSTPRLGTSGLATPTTQARPSIAKVAQRLTAGRRPQGTTAVAAVQPRVAQPRIDLPPESQVPLAPTDLGGLAEAPQPEGLLGIEPAGVQPDEFSLPKYQELITRFPNVGPVDAAWLLQFADHWETRLPEVAAIARSIADIFTRFIGGIITEEQAKAEVDALLGGEAIEPPPPPPGGTEFTTPAFSERVNRFPNIDQADAQWLLQFAAFWEANGGDGTLIEAARAIADIFTRFVAGLLTEEQARSELDTLTGGGPGVEPPGVIPPDEFSLPKYQERINKFPNIDPTDVLWLLQFADAIEGTNPEVAATARTISDIFNRFLSGLITEEQARAEVAALLEGSEPIPSRCPEGQHLESGVCVLDETGEPPSEFGELPFLPPGIPAGADAQEIIDIVAQLLDTDPTLWDANLANFFYTRGMFAIGDLIRGVIDGTLSPEDAVQALRTWLATVEAPEGGDIDIGALRRAIQDLYNELGIDPGSVTDTDFDRPGVQLTTSANLPGVLGTIGIDQEFVQDTGSGVVYAILDGQLVAIAGSLGEAQERYGIRPSSVLSLNPTQFAQFGEAGEFRQGGLTPAQQKQIEDIRAKVRSRTTITQEEIREIALFAPDAADILRRFAAGEMDIEVVDVALRGIGGLQTTSQVPLFGGELDRLEASKFAAPREALIEPNTGLLLPSIRKVAAIWQQLDPFTKRVITQAYDLAGLSGGAAAFINDQLNFFSPRGSFSPANIAQFG